MNRSFCDHQVRFDGHFLVCLVDGKEQRRFSFGAEEGRQRAAVINEVYSWIGTPYHHMGRVKGHGVDCATLVAEVYEKAGVVNYVDIQFYPIDWNMHRDTERYLAYVREHMVEIPQASACPGDFVMFRWGRTFAHGAIIVDPGFPSVVHADRTAGQVFRADVSGGPFVNRPRIFFRPKIWS